MLKLISDLQQSTQALRQALLDRGLSSSVSMTWYNDNIDSKGEIHLINEPLIPIDYKDTFETFVEKIFLYPTLEEQRCKFTDHQKRNQLTIDRMKGDF